MKKTSCIIAVLVSLIILFFPIFFFWIIALFSNLKLHFLVPVIGIMLVILTGRIAFIISNKIPGKKSIIFLSAIILLMLGAIKTESYYKHNYIPSITVGQNIGFWKNYLPFTDSDKLARLDSASSLHFSEEAALPVVDGATALVPVYCSIVEAVYPSDCKITDYVKFNTTTGAYKNLIEGKNDIIFVAQPSEEQIKEAAEAGIEFNLYPIGYEAFVFLVNQKNPVNNLTLEQIKAIYTGKITNWKDAGGKNQVIRPFQRDKNSGSQTAFLSLMGKTEELLPPETHQVSDMDGLVDVVSDYQNHSNAIGYSFRYYVEKMNKNINVKILSLNGIHPTIENIKNKTYPVTDNFYAITIKGKESENSKKLINWILSKQGQEIIQKTGYVPLSEE